MNMAGLDFVSDILLGLGALAAAFYCVVLARKLNRLSGLDQELGNAIAVLSKQVDEMTAILQEAQSSADEASARLGDLTERAEDAAARLQSHPEISDAPTQPSSGDLTPEAGGGDAPSEPSMFIRHARAAS